MAGGYFIYCWINPTKLASKCKLEKESLKETMTDRIIEAKYEDGIMEWHIPAPEWFVTFAIVLMMLIYIGYSKYTQRKDQRHRVSAFNMVDYSRRYEPNAPVYSRPQYPTRPPRLFERQEEV